MKHLAPAACLLAALAITGCSEPADVTQPTPLAQTLNPSLPAPNLSGPLAVEDASNDGAIRPDLAAVRRATAAFHRQENAMAAGYLFHEPCVESPAGAMGIHAPNPALLESPALDPEQPELLLYLPKPGGGLRLIGVEYMQVVLLRNSETGEVGPWLSTSPWPSSHVVVTPTPELFGQTFQGPMPGHTPDMPWHWDLHAWIWAHNPAGMFAEWNPSLRCPAGP